MLLAQIYGVSDGNDLPLALECNSGAELNCNIIHHANRSLSPAALKVVELVKAL